MQQSPDKEAELRTEKWQSTEFSERKVGMTQLFDDKGDVHPVTVLQAGPCVVTQRKTVTKDGYDAAQIGLVEFVKESRLTKAMKGHFGKNNLPPVRFMREVAIVIDSEGQDGDQGRRQSPGGHLRRREVCGYRSAPARDADLRA